MTAPSATITGPLVYPGTGRPVAARTVTVACVGPEGAVLATSDGGLVGGTVLHTDDTGGFTVDLPLNSDVDEASGVGPPGTYWRFTVGSTPAVSWCVRLDPGDEGRTIVIGTGAPGDATRVVDPTPRGWVPIAGPPGEDSTVPGPAGPTGVLTGPLAERPAAPEDAPLVWVASDSDVPLSVWDGTAWADVDASPSRLLTAVHLTASSATQTIPKDTPTVIDATVTPDGVHPGGPVRVWCPQLVVPIGICTDADSSGVQLVESTDGGDTWTVLGPTPTVDGTFVPTPSAVAALPGLFRATGVVEGVSWQPAGTTVRFGIRMLTDVAGDMLVLAGTSLLAAAI